MPVFIKPIAPLITSQTKSTSIEPQIEKHLNYLEAELKKSLWFAGNEFTAADIQMSFPIEGAVARAGLDNSRPRLMKFLDLLHARPSYQRALDRGGKYEFTI